MNYRQELLTLHAEFERQQNCYNELMPAEKFNRRMKLLQSTFEKTTKLCDRLRNLNEIELANESDLSVQFEIHLMKTNINNELKLVYAETENELNKLRTTHPISTTTSFMHDQQNFIPFKQNPTEENSSSSSSTVIQGKINSKARKQKLKPKLKNKTTKLFFKIKPKSDKNK